MITTKSILRRSIRMGFLTLLAGHIAFAKEPIVKKIYDQTK